MKDKEGGRETGGSERVRQTDRQTEREREREIESEGGRECV